MGPEEYHYLEKFNNEYFKNIREVRISSLYWIWDSMNSKNPTIRTSVVIELIPYTSLVELLSELEDEERYEDCKVVFDIMKLYKVNLFIYNKK